MSIADDMKKAEELDLLMEHAKRLGRQEEREYTLELLKAMRREEELSELLLRTPPSKYVN